MADPATKPKRGRDVTKTARQASYLERLESGEGKRLVVDLDATGRADLEALLSAGYGATQKDVVLRALRAAASSKNRRKSP
jgi:hypothetical protein